MIDLRHWRFALAIAVMGPAALCSQGCGSEEIPSAWTSTLPSIDGNLSEWRNARFTLIDEPRCSFAACNDAEYLYLSARIIDRNLRRRIAAQEITIWIDPSGGTSKELEMHIPSWVRGRLDLSRGGFLDVLTRDEQQRVERRLDEIQQGVLVTERTSSDTRSFEKGSTDGFAGAKAFEDTTVTLEVRIPLNISTYFGDLKSISSKTSLGIALGEGVPQAGSRRMETPMQGGYGRGMGRRGERRPAESRPATEFWITIALARHEGA